MSDPIYDITSCLPSPLPARIKQTGYNIWGVLTSGVYVFYTTNPGGKFTSVDVLPCLAGLEVNTAFHVQIGDHVYTMNDFFLDPTDSKFKCGRPNDR